MGETTETAKGGLRRKVLFQWGIPIAVGTFSFFYWFLLFPLVWSSLAVKEWHFLWFSGFALAAFVLWLAIIAPFVWLWHSRQDHLVEISPVPTDEALYPTYPTKASAVQPKGYNVTYTPYSKSGSQESFIPVPAQKDGTVTPSLYNAKTGRDSFQSGHCLDSPGRQPCSDADSAFPKPEPYTALTRENSGVQLSKKVPGEASHTPISISSGSSRDSWLDFKNIPRHPADGLDTPDTFAEVEMHVINDGLDSPDAMTEDKFALEEQVELNNSRTFAENEKQALATETDIPETPEGRKGPLEREESFRGLPEMGHFDAYLHLVTVDTPMSPREAFFQDLAKDEEEGVVRRDHRKSYHPGADLEEAQRRIAAARKSLPPLLHYPDLELGEARVLKTATLPVQGAPPPQEEVSKQRAGTLPPQERRSSSPTTLIVEDEVTEDLERRRTSSSLSSQSSLEGPRRPPYLRTYSEGRHPGPRPRTSEEFFVSYVTRLDSVTSEAQLEVGEGPSEGISRWDTRFSSIAKTPTSTKSEEGRFVVLKNEYAHNFIEAFIKVEKDALEKERQPSRGPTEEQDSNSDNVFLEF